MPASAPVATGVRLWIDGLLAGRYSRVAAAPAERPTQVGPLALWESQTGNAEEFAAQVAGRLGRSRLVNMDDMPLAELAAAREVLVTHGSMSHQKAHDYKRELVAAKRYVRDAC